MSLEKRVVVITGATGGLGKETARQFAAQGARLALVSTNPDKLQAVIDELNLPAECTLTMAADLRQPESSRSVVKQILGHFGRADALINLVGGWIGGKTLLETTPDETASMLEQHLWSTYYLAQAFLPHFAENGWGRIIVVSSPAASRPSGNNVAYAVGKAAQEALMLTIAQEVKHSGVTANIIQVSAIDVEHRRLTAPSKGNASWTLPEEIAAAILYLCSEEAKMLNGVRLPLVGAP